ncbi:hypothetical protein [Nocardia bovistercoris]|nr:hypothetical protein [Nocardia bovistercoris]
MGDMLTLEEWAARHGYGPDTVRNQWSVRDDFPTHKRHRPRVGSGARSEEYDADELDTWLTHWHQHRRPTPHSVPEHPDEYRTLGAIARLLGLDGKTVTQYRALMDEHAEHEDRGQRRYYRTRDVVTALNARPGHGRTTDPDTDRRRKP